MPWLLCSLCSFMDQLLSRKLASGIDALKYVRLFGQRVCGGERGGCLWLKGFGVTWLFWCFLFGFFFLFGFAKFLSIVGKVRALCLSCGGKGIVKSCFIICVWINVQILLSLLCPSGCEYKYGSPWEWIEARKTSHVNILGGAYCRHLC